MATLRIRGHEPNDGIGRDSVIGWSTCETTCCVVLGCRRSVRLGGRWCRYHEGEFDRIARLKWRRLQAGSAQGCSDTPMDRKRPHGGLR
jgi:hypothetical protein